METTVLFPKSSSIACETTSWKTRSTFGGWKFSIKISRSLWVSGYVINHSIWKAHVSCKQWDEKMIKMWRCKLVSPSATHFQKTPRPSIQETLSGHGLHKSHLESNGDLHRPSRQSIQAVLHHSPHGCFKSSGTREEKELQTVNAKDLPRIQKDWIFFTWYFMRFEFYRKYLPSILGNPWVHMPVITPYFRKGGYVGR